VASIAGPAGIASWVIGGLPYCCWGLSIASWGRRCRAPGDYPLSGVFHGELMGYLLGFITLIAFSSLISIEIVAARQYAAAWFPMLTQPGSSSRRCWAGWCSFCCSVSSSA
jgi:amino acid transporter